MSDTINIYGHEIELEKAESHITDVIILAREISYNSDGTMNDSVLISSTTTSTYIMQRGIIEVALEAIRNPE